MCALPVELIDVLYVSKEAAHLLRLYGKVTHIDNVSQVVLGKRKKKAEAELYTKDRMSWKRSHIKSKVTQALKKFFPLEAE